MRSKWDMMRRRESTEKEDKEREEYREGRDVERRARIIRIQRER